MGSVYEWLQEQASSQLDRLSSKVVDGEWFDKLMSELADQVTGANLDDTTSSASLEAIDLLIENKALLVGLGSHAFNLLLCQITCGRDEEARATYIRALSNADDLIALMNSGSDGVIRAKMELDALNANAKKLTVDLLTAGIRYLIPFLLAAI
jgi:hypothetical protein